MQLKKFANRIGFTETEFKVLFFLAVVFFAGLLIKYFNLEKNVYRNFDYRKEDSLFWSGDSINNNQQTELKVLNEKEKIKNEVLGLSQTDITKIQKKETLKELSININSADKNDLMNLPGIGEKTAQRIIEFRNKVGKFKSIEDLKEVKGIRNTKLEKIRKYIYVN
jgi:comEA protein